MKSILLLILFLSTVAQAVATGIYNYRLDTSSTNLTASFPTVAQFTGPTNTFAEVDINNPTSGEIEVNCAASTTPSSDASNSFHIPAGGLYNSTNSVAVQVPMGKKCWLRSESGTLSAGVIIIIGYGY